MFSCIVVQKGKITNKIITIIVLFINNNSFTRPIWTLTKNTKISVNFFIHFCTIGFRGYQLPRNSQSSATLKMASQQNNRKIYWNLYDIAYVTFLTINPKGEDKTNTPLFFVFILIFWRPVIWGFKTFLIKFAVNFSKQMIPNLNTILLFIKEINIFV